MTHGPAVDIRRDVLHEALPPGVAAEVVDAQAVIVTAMRRIVDTVNAQDLDAVDGLLVWQVLKTDATAVHLEWTRHLLDARQRYSHHLDLETAAHIAAADLSTYDGLLQDFLDRLGGYADPAQRGWAAHQVVIWLEGWANQIRTLRADAIEDAVNAGASPSRLACLLGVTRQALNQWRRSALAAASAPGRRHSTGAGHLPP